MDGFENIFSYIDSLSYVGIFFIFMAYFLPVPEEVILLILGYLAALGDMNLYAVIAAGTLGIMAADNIWFFLGRTNSRFLAKIKNRLGKEKIAAYEDLLKRNTGKYIFLVRFIPGVRAAGAAIAGSAKLRKKHFWIYNILAVAVYSPSLVVVGYIFQHKLEYLVERVELARHLIFMLILSLVGLTAAVFAGRRIFKK